MMSADKRKTMMDDERYPIAVIPEGIDFRGEEKIATPISAISTSTYPAYPPDYKTASLGGVMDGNASTSTLAVPGVVAAERGPMERSFATGSSYAEAQLPPRSEARRPWWKKKSIVLLLVLIFTVMIVSMAGGIYAHNLRQKNTSINSNNSTSAGETTATQVKNNTLNSVASSGLFLNDKTTWNMQTYWQTSTGSIMQQMSLDGTTFKTAKNLTLQIAPKVGSPLSATATTDTSGIVYLTLFYITTDNKIAMSGQACAVGTASCSSTTNTIVSGNLSTPPSNWTGLAVVNVDDAQDWRVYFHDKQGFMTELAGNPSGFGNGTLIGGNGLNASSIAATNINSTTNNINLFYVDSLTQALFTMEFSGSWTVPAVLSPERITTWNPLSGLSACYTKTPDQLHMYYTGLDEKIYEFLGTNASSQSTVWGAQPGNNHIWASADYVGADITAVGWKDQVRFFQVSDSKLVQGTLSNTTWTEAFVTAASS